MKKTSGKRRAREKVSKTMTLKSFTRSIRSAVAKLFSTMATAMSPPKQSGIEGGGPIRIASRLKEGRALAQDVWSIYKFVVITRSLLRTIMALICSSLQCSKSTSRLHQSGTGLYELCSARLDQGSC